MSWSDYFQFGFGMGLGYSASEGAMNAISSAYRAKGFDPVVRRDLLDIMSRGRLAKIEYPFPTKVKPQKKAIFLVRHKILPISLIVVVIIIRLLCFNEALFMKLTPWISFFYGLFVIGYLGVLLIKKLLRGGKKASDLVFQSQFISQGKKYWNIREYVRKALKTGELDAKGAYVRLRNTDLGRQLPDTDTELEAIVFNRKKKSAK